MMRLEKYWENMQQELKLFCFLLLTLCLYRLIFIGSLSGYMESGTGASDIALACWTGLRLSLKSAGGVTALSFVLVTLPNLVQPRWQLGKVRLIIGTLASLVMAVLFLARFPYYREYHSTYNLQVFAGMNDDKEAIFWMVWEEYGLLWRFVLALAFAGLAFVLLKKLLATRTLSLPARLARLPRPASALLLALCTVFFMFFARFGGGLSYATGINWENAGLTRDNFLNECILDDFQAMYRAYSSNKKMKAGEIFGVDKGGELAAAQKLRELAGEAPSGSTDINALLTRTAPGPKLEKPRHIFIILGESWAEWPLLEKYQELHVGDGFKSLAAAPNSYESRCFMPNGDFTSIAITGMITGLPDVHINVNYQPKSYKEVYPTAMAQYFKALGYEADFYYGGTPSWDNIARLAEAQGFDNFYGYPELDAPKVTAWGSNDRYLFRGLSVKLAEKQVPTVNVIMTVSNHPPYQVDLAAEGFDYEKAKEVVRQVLPEAEEPDTLAWELGHYWYMDKVVTEFIRETEARYPDSLFIITGDHAVRTNPGPRPTLYEHQSVPFLLHGQGVTRDILPENAVGGHIGIVPTLLNLIAPQGFTYRAIGLPLGRAKSAFNRDYWLTDSVMGRVTGQEAEYLPSPAHPATDFAKARADMEEELKSQRTLAWYLLQAGK